MKAIVSFRDYGNHPLKWMLKEGFRHVVVAVLTPGGYWVEIDYAVGVPVITVVGGNDSDLNKYYEDQGYITVERSQTINKQFKFNLFRGNIFVANCVGLVKAILGLDSFAITPYQLYKDIKK
jgi:hypothetical protein